MTIIFNCVSSMSGGAQAYLRNIPKLLVAKASQQGLHDIVFVAYEYQASLLESVPLTSVELIPSRHLSGPMRYQWERRNLPEIAAKHRAEVIYTPYQVAPYLPNLRNVMMIRNLEPFLLKRYKYTVSGWLRNSILAEVSTRCLRSADRVISVSQLASRHLLRLGIGDERVRMIYHGGPNLLANDDEEDSVLGLIGLDSSFLLTCGSMLPYRRYEDVITAFNSIIDELPPFTKLVVAGSGTDKAYERYIRNIVANSPDPARIVLLGNVPWRTVVALYRRCLLFIMSSEVEACPNIALEAMATGCPIISASCPPLPEIFDGCSAEYAARDTEALARCVLMVLSVDKYRDELKISALNRSSHFRWSASADKTLSALTEWD